MANAVKAIEMILKQEGGFVNDPLDRGGATNMGITQKTYSNFVGRQVTVDEVRNMPKQDAITIYKAEYWDKIGGDMIKDDGVAYVIFDLAVHSGPKRAFNQAQRLIGVAEKFAMTNEDIKIINKIDPVQFIEKYIEETLKWYESIIQRNPSQSKWRWGWRRRAEKAKNYALSVTSGKVPIPWAKYSAISASILLLIGGSILFFKKSNKSKQIPQQNSNNNQAA